MSVAVMVLCFNGGGPALAVVAGLILFRGWLILMADWSRAHGNRFAGVIVGTWLAVLATLLILCFALVIRALLGDQE